MTLFNQTDFMKTLEQLKDIVELSAITRDSRGSRHRQEPYKDIC